MNHIMIDLETLGTQPGSVIISIGAVLFDQNQPIETCLGDSFYSVVNQASSESYGMTKSQDTLDWWDRQSDEARKVLSESETGGNTLHDTLCSLAAFIPVGAKVWSNGANFDQPLLDVAYDRCKISLPWKYYYSRCYRTITSLHPDEKSLRPATVLAHNALEDAKWQARHMVNIAQLLNLKL